MREWPRACDTSGCREPVRFAVIYSPLGQQRELIRIGACGPHLAAKIFQHIPRAHRARLLIHDLSEENNADATS